MSCYLLNVQSCFKKLYGSSVFCDPLQTIFKYTLFVMVCSLSISFNAQAYKDPNYLTLTPEDFLETKVYWPRYGAGFDLSVLRPIISENTAVKNLYNDFFTGPKSSKSIIPNHPLVYSFYFEWTPWERFGLWGPYVRLSYWQTSGRSLLCTSTTSCNFSNIEIKAFGTVPVALTAIPIAVGGVYHFDYFLRRYNLPVLFSGKLGLDYWYWAGSINGKTSKYKNAKVTTTTDKSPSAVGYTLGLEASGKIAVGIDIFNQHRPIYAMFKGTAHYFFFTELVLQMGKDILGRNVPDFTSEEGITCHIGFMTIFH